MEQVIEEISSEPCYANSGCKNEFLQELKSKTETMEWAYFVAEISDPILSFVCERTKILPMNQYEEALKKLNSHLNNSDKFNSLKQKLENICEVEITPTVAGRLVFRFAFKLMEQIQSFVVQKMQTSKSKSHSSTSPQQEPVEMSEIEEKAFCQLLGEIFRAQTKKHSDVSKHKQNSCMRDNFVYSQQVVSSEEFMRKDVWFSGNENSIIPSDNAINFFKIVEKECRCLESDNRLKTVDEVLENILDCNEATYLWYFLTNNYFSETDSLLFMKELVRTFVDKSKHLEEKRRNRIEETAIRESQAALRTHLQRNFENKKSKEL